MLLLENPTKERNLLQSKYSYYHPPVPYNIDCRELDKNFKNDMRSISDRINENKDSDSTRAFLTAFLVVALAAYMQNRITCTVESKLNEQFSNIFR